MASEGWQTYVEIEHLLLLLALDPVLGIGEVARLEGRVDDHLVFAGLQLEQLAVGEAEAPGALVVGGPIGHHVRLLGERVQPLRAAVRAEIVARTGSL